MSRPLVIPSVSTEYVRVSVSGSESGTFVNPTTVPVSMAFMQSGEEPEPGDWTTASWDTDDSTPVPTFYALCLVGPGAVVLPDGDYAVWTRVEDTPENAVRRAGRLVIS